MKVTRFTLFRIIVLLACLASVATISAHQRDATRSWEKSIEVSIFPINADGTDATQRYIDQLDDKDFGIINRWGARDLNGNPVQPVGLAHPNRRPMYPQRAAEIMSGRIPRTALRSTMAESLKHVVINPYTATEINWIK